jgi:hypothetical protein
MSVTVVPIRPAFANSGKDRPDDGVTQQGGVDAGRVLVAGAEPGHLPDGPAAFMAVYVSQPEAVATFIVQAAVGPADR